MDNLPFRVVIYRILPYYPFNIHTKSTFETYDLFGYFKKDRSRKIWFLFPSVGFFCYSYDPKGVKIYLNHSNIPVVSFRNISVLKIFHSSDDHRLNVIDHLTHESSGMYKLECLDVIDMKSNCEEDYVGLLSRQSSFPNLKSLKLRMNKNFGNEIDSVSVNSGPFSRISKLKIRTERDFVESNLGFRDSSFFIKCSKYFEKNLSELSLSNVHLQNDVSIQLPKLEYLVMSFCSNLFIISCESLKRLRIDNMQALYLQEIMRKSTNLKSLALINIIWPKRDDHWFLDYSFNPLSKLEKVEFRNVATETFYWNKRLSSEWCNRFRHQLKDFHVLGCDSFSHCLKMDHPNLIRLKCCVKSLDLSIGYNSLEELYGCGCSDISNDSLIEDSFRKNEWKKLRILRLDLFLAVGDKWNDIPNLVILHLIDMEKFENIFFEEHEFQNLEELVINNLIKITGEGWISFPKLIKMKIKSCDNITDQCFKELVFPSLRTLKLFELPCVTGKGWNIIPKLKRFEVAKCPFFELDEKDFEGTSVEFVYKNYKDFDVETWRV